MDILQQPVLDPLGGDIAHRRRRRDQDGAARQQHFDAFLVEIVTVLD